MEIKSVTIDGSAHVVMDPDELFWLAETLKTSTTPEGAAPNAAHFCNTVLAELFNVAATLCALADSNSANVSSINNLLSNGAAEYIKTFNVFSRKKL